MGAENKTKNLDGIEARCLRLRELCRRGEPRLIGLEMTSKWFSLLFMAGVGSRVKRLPAASPCGCLGVYTGDSIYYAFMGGKVKRHITYPTDGRLKQRT